MHFAQSVQKHVFPEPHIIQLKPITVLNKMVSPKRGSIGEGPLRRIFAQLVQTPFFEFLEQMYFTHGTPSYLFNKQKNVFFLYLGQFGTLPLPKVPVCMCACWGR